MVWTIFRLLVAERPLDPHADRRAIAHRQRLVVEPVGEDRLRVVGVDQVGTLVIELPAPTARRPCCRSSDRPTKRAAGFDPAWSRIGPSRVPVHLAMQLQPSTQSCRVTWLCAGMLRSSSSEKLSSFSTSPVTREPVVGEIVGLEREIFRRLRIGRAVRPLRLADFALRHKCAPAFCSPASSRCAW